MNPSGLNNLLKYCRTNTNGYLLYKLVKKAVSISMVLLMLIAILHLAVATHFCCNTFAGATISVSGKLASCGMENDRESRNLPFSGTRISPLCCSDHITYVKIDSDFIPTLYSEDENFQIRLNFFDLPLINSFDSFNILSAKSANENPPGPLLSSGVDLSDICVYRI